MKTRRITTTLTIDTDSDADADRLQSDLAENVLGLMEIYAPQHRELDWPSFCASIVDPGSPASTQTRHITVELTIGTRSDSDADRLQEELAEDIGGLLDEFAPQHKILHWPSYEHEVRRTDEPRDDHA